MWDGSGRRSRRSRRGVRGAARAQEKRQSRRHGESVLRQKEACREAVEKCRAGRGAHIQWGGGINGIIQDYNTTPFK